MEQNQRLKINTCVNLISNKSAKAIQWGRERFFNK